MALEIKWQHKKKFTEEDKKKDILLLYEEGNGYFKEKFEGFSLEKKAAAIAVITSMDCKSKELEQWLAENYSPLIASVCREKLINGYNLENALALLKEKKKGIKARVLPSLERIFQAMDYTIISDNCSFDRVCGKDYIYGYLEVRANPICFRVCTLISDLDDVVKKLSEGFASKGVPIQIEDLIKIAKPISSYFQAALKKKKLAETKKIWTINDSYISEKETN